MTRIKVLIQQTIQLFTNVLLNSNFKYYNKLFKFNIEFENKCRCMREV